MNTAVNQAVWSLYRQYAAEEKAGKAEETERVDLLSLIECKSAADLKSLLGSHEKFSVSELAELTSQTLPSDGPFSHSSGYRLPWINCFLSWGPPLPEAELELLFRFVEDKRVLEIASGAGLYSRVLQALGVDVVATDPRSFTEEGLYEDNAGEISYLPIEQLTDVEAVEKYGDSCDVLMVVWESHPLPLKALKKFTGSRIVVVGEEEGRSANPVTGWDVWPSRNPLNKDKEIPATSWISSSDHPDWDEVARYDIPSWTFADDRVYFYERSEQPDRQG